MPLLVAQLNVPATEFGLVISAFGLSKLLGNIPSGYLVERYGRKPVLVAGLGMCGVGLGAIGTNYTAYHGAAGAVLPPLFSLYLSLIH
jgi:MFS family permease